MSLLASIRTKSVNNQKQIAVLLDPDDLTEEKTRNIVDLSEKAGVDYFFIGGSLITKTNFDTIAFTVKENTDIPLLIFPGSVFQITDHVDAILFLSLISGRNPEYLIGQHVHAAPRLHKSGIEVIPTGYMLVDSGKLTTALYISNTSPLPCDKPDIAASTALAGEMLGQKLLYLDGGSGAQNPVPDSIIQAVKTNTTSPLIVGGGLRNTQQINATCKAGADIVVVGNHFEKSPEAIASFAETVHRF